MTLSRSAAFSIAIAAAALLAAAAYATATAAKRLADPTAVAVVRLDAVFDGLDELAVLESQIQQSINERQAQIDALEERARTLQEELQNVEVPGTPTYEAKANELIEIEPLARVRGEIFQRRIAAEKGAVLVTLYEKIREAAEAVAAREGYDIVLIDDAANTFPVRTEAGVIGEIQTRSVLFATDSVDITDLVRTFLNNRFQAGQN